MRRIVALLPLLLLLTSGCMFIEASQAGPDESESLDTPPVDVEVVADGLEHVWAVGFLPDGSALLTERSGRLKLLPTTDPGVTPIDVAADFSQVYDNNEAGLMGLVIHPDFETTRRFSTCQSHAQSGRPVDVRVVTWELSPDGRSAQPVVDPLVSGIPVNATGRHAGCRLFLGPEGALYITTGDSATGSVPQDRTQLGGKVLRVSLDSGAPLPDNPFIDSPNPAERLVYTYGHRNPQGIAQRPGTDDIYLSEHGPDVDDEINVLRAGGNYGWDPSRGGQDPFGYDESVPMTDTEAFPDAVPAAWSSGGETEAICGATFLVGEHWGALDGALAVAALKGQKLLLMRVDGQGTDSRVTEVAQLPELNDEYGRLRAATQGPDGSLYVSTSNGNDDQLLRVTPRNG